MKNSISVILIVILCKFCVMGDGKDSKVRSSSFSSVDITVITPPRCATTEPRTRKALPSQAKTEQSKVELATMIKGMIDLSAQQEALLATLDDIEDVEQCKQIIRNLTERMAGLEGVSILMYQNILLMQSIIRQHEGLEERALDLDIKIAQLNGIIRIFRQGIPLCIHIQDDVVDDTAAT